MLGSLDVNQHTCRILTCKNPVGFPLLDPLALCTACPALVVPAVSSSMAAFTHPACSSGTRVQACGPRGSIPTLLLRPPVNLAPLVTRRPSTLCRSSIRDEDGSNKSFMHPEMESGSSSPVPDTLPFSGVDSDWREFRARLVASSRNSSNSQLREAEQGNNQGIASQLEQQQPSLWAHSLPRPEKGCLLLAHPMMFSSSQEYFFQSVIFILEHTEKGSYGVILNRPSTYVLSQLSLTHPLPEFDSCKLYVGGDVGGGEITLLHTHSNLEGSAEVVRGVHVGGIHAAQAAVAAGKAHPSEFRFFAKYAGWGPGQLESECKRGVWFTAAASPAVVMLEPGEGDGSDRWHACLSLLGGDYEQLSMNVKASEQWRNKRRVQSGERGASSGAGADGDQSKQV